MAIFQIIQFLMFLKPSMPSPIAKEHLILRNTLKVLPVKPLQRKGFDISYFIFRRTCPPTAHQISHSPF